MMSVENKSCGDQSLISAVGLVSCSGLNTSNWELLALSDGPGPVHFTWSGECSFQLHMLATFLSITHTGELHMLATEKFLSITHATENSFVVLTKQIREVGSISLIG